MKKEKKILCIGGPLDGTFTIDKKVLEFTAPWPRHSLDLWCEDRNYEKQTFTCSLYKLETLRSVIGIIEQLNFCDHKVYVCQDDELDIIAELIKGYKNAI